MPQSAEGEGIAQRSVEVTGEGMVVVVRVVVLWVRVMVRGPVRVIERMVWVKGWRSEEQNGVTLKGSGLGTG